MADVVSRDRILEAATRLFAALGFDGASVGLIADAVGTSPRDITSRIGDKQELYTQVLMRAFEAEYAVLQGAVEATGSGRETLHRVVDAYLDLHVEHPEIGAIWMHRWMSDALDIADLEDRYRRPLRRLCAQKISGSLIPNADPDYVIATMVWCIIGFVGSGVMAQDSGMAKASDPTALTAFRSHMHLLMDRMLGPGST